MKSLRTYFEYVIDIIFPRTCVGCSKKNTDLCNRCAKKIPRAQNPEYSFIHACFDYRDPRIRALIKKLKYKNAQRIAHLFGENLYQELLSMYEESLLTPNKGSILLIPIPLHTQRLHDRGYNQSELIAQAIAKADRNNMLIVNAKILKRTRNTNTQAQKEHRKERFENLKEAFICDNEDLVQGRDVILIDDVTTTGATLKDAQRALLAAKARSVMALTIAH